MDMRGAFGLFGSEAGLERFSFNSHLFAGTREQLGVLWMEPGGPRGGGAAPCSLSPAPINQMELGNESDSTVGATWECNKHLERKSSIFP